MFISFKDSDRENGIERTQDSIDAQDLYNALVAEGYKEMNETLDMFDKALNTITTEQTKFGGVANRLDMTTSTLETNTENLYVATLNRGGSSYVSHNVRGTNTSTTTTVSVNDIKVNVGGQIKLVGDGGLNSVNIDGLLYQLYSGDYDLYGYEYTDCRRRRTKIS